MMAYDHGFHVLRGFRDAFDRIVGTMPGRSCNRDTVFIEPVLTPLGPMVAAATEKGICLLEFSSLHFLETQIQHLKKHLNCTVVPGQNSYLEKLDKELKRYFRGELKDFSVPLVVVGSEFQCDVWEFLRRIPYGETRSYVDQAQAIGSPSAQRAVGRANGDNRLTILIPCHRVIRSDGTISGYGGGVWRKRFLLDLERNERALPL